MLVCVCFVRGRKQKKKPSKTKKGSVYKKKSESKECCFDAAYNIRHCVIEW